MKNKFPNDVKLPYFAYGLLKSNELAHQKITAFLDRDPEKATINGSLWVRDGLPLLDYSAKGNEIVGQILTFHKNTWATAYETVCEFEPEGQYRWKAIEIYHGRTVNVRLGRSPDHRSIYYNEKEWGGEKDPVFTIAMNVIKERMAESEPAPRLLIVFVSTRILSILLSKVAFVSTNIDATGPAVTRPVKVRPPCLV